MTLPEQKRAPMFYEGRHWTVDPDSGCWLWSGASKRGYARCITGQASREVWRQSGRLLDPNDDLHHTCPNTLCVNPYHLEPRARGLHQAQHHRVFTVEQIREIKALVRGGMRQCDVAERFGVYWSTISKIMRGENYAGVE